jgi:hypothetical protein
MYKFSPDFFYLSSQLLRSEKSLLVYNTLATGKEPVMAADTAKALAIRPQKQAVTAQNTVI